MLPRGLEPLPCRVRTGCAAIDAKEASRDGLSVFTVFCARRGFPSLKRFVAPERIELPQRYAAALQAVGLTNVQQCHIALLSSYITFVISDYSSRKYPY